MTTMSDDPKVAVPNAWNTIARGMSERGQFHAAAAVARRAALLAPKRADLQSNLGNMLRRTGDRRGAERALETAIDLDPRLVDARFNYAVLLATEFGDHERALAYYGACLAERSGDGNMLFARACSLLAAGRWHEGFEAYDCRLADRSFGWPFWDGKPLGRKSLLVSAEQGLGDTIMYHRFALELARREPDADICYLTPTVLARLLGAARAGVAVPNSGFDWQIPMMSLPHAMGIAEVGGEPYIKPIQHMYMPQPPGTKHRIGLVWRAKAGIRNMTADQVAHGNDKSIPLHLLFELTRIKGAQLYGLQAHNDDIETYGAGEFIQDMGGSIHDFSDLASFIAQCDVLVTADTAPAHLGGALGVPTVVCCHNYAAWQWGSGERAPWYDSVRIVRGPFDADVIATAVEDCLAS